MFFFKKNETAKPERFVVVLGTSPLAMFLTCVLQQNNVEVVILKTTKQSKNDGYVLKCNTQSQRFSFNIVDTLNKKPDYCFIASSFDEYRNDLLLLSNEIFKEVKTINFASFYNHEITKQMNDFKEIRAYFNGWLVKDNKEISVFNRSAEIDICCGEEQADDLCKILSNKILTIKTQKNSRRLFLQKMVPWFLGNLMLLSYKEDVSKLLLNQELRQNMDDIINEILQIIDSKKRLMTDHSFLPDIYAFPDGFESEFNSLRGVEALSEFVKGVDPFNSPKLFNLIALAYKKY